LGGAFDPASQTYAPSRGGFVRFPAGVVTDDPGGGMQPAEASSGRTSTAARPILHGFGGLSYDSAATRWIPTSSALVSPDGSEYAYPEFLRAPSINSPTAIHVVTVATGSDRVVYSRGAIDVPIAFRAEGIYLVTGRWEALSVGLRLLDPRSGSVRVLAITGGWSVVSGGAAWGIDADLGGIGLDPHRIDRLDLATGAVTTWYEVPSDRLVEPIGLDLDGAPIIVVWTNGTSDVPSIEHVYRVLSRTQTVHLFAAGIDEAIGDFTADSHGLWFASAYIYDGLWYGGLWLYTDGVGLRLVAESNNAMRIERVAGPCT
jgi:hypothetical protein